LSDDIHHVVLSDGFNQIVLSSMVREGAEHSDDSRLSSMADVDCKGRTSMVFSMMDQGRVSNVECDSRRYAASNIEGLRNGEDGSDRHWTQSMLFVLLPHPALAQVALHMTRVRELHVSLLDLALPTAFVVPVCRARDTGSDDSVGLTESVFASEAYRERSGSVLHTQLNHVPDNSFTMMYNDGPKGLAVAAVGTAWGCASLEDLVPPALNVLVAKVLRPDTESDSKKQSVRDSSSADVMCTAPADRSNDSCMTRMLLRLLALESSAHALLFGEFMGLIFARALLSTVTLQIEGQVPVSDLECDVCNYAAPSSPGRGDAGSADWRVLFSTATSRRAAPSSPGSGNDSSADCGVFSPTATFQVMGQMCISDIECSDDSRLLAEGGPTFHLGERELWASALSDDIHHVVLSDGFNQIVLSSMTCDGVEHSDDSWLPAEGGPTFHLGERELWTSALSDDIHQSLVGMVYG